MNSIFKTTVNFIIKTNFMMDFVLIPQDLCVYVNFLRVQYNWVYRKIIHHFHLNITYFKSIGNDNKGETR